MALFRRTTVRRMTRKLFFAAVAFVVCSAIGGTKFKGFFSHVRTPIASTELDGVGDEFPPQKRLLLSTNNTSPTGLLDTGEGETEEEEEPEFSQDGGDGNEEEEEGQSQPTTDEDLVLKPKPFSVHPTKPTTAWSTIVTSSEPSEVTAKMLEPDCTPPAYHEFPPDLFTRKQRSHGAIVVHISVIIYMFYAVAVVCDDYFISSLEECCARLQLSEDVAGATFMAAGSSAPELFTAILGVLVAKGDVGTGTIVGSAVFNVLFVIGICGIFAGRAVDLTWWPLFRDSTFYAFTVIVLIAIIFDSQITWYESVIMMFIYSIYIVIMKFSSDLHFWFNRKLGIEENSSASLGILNQGDKKNYSSYVPFNDEIDQCASQAVTARYHANVPADESIRDYVAFRPSLYEAALRMLMKPQFKPKTRFRAAAWRIMLEFERRRQEGGKGPTVQSQVSLDSDLPKWRSRSLGSNVALAIESNWKRIPSREEGFLAFVKWILQAPLMAVLYCTIPDCKKDRWRKYFMLTFFMSITWTAVFSYVMVWMVTLVGYTLGIPDSIMGITFLAAGTSVPDAFASLIVARQGQGDMAVSNSIGSNVFDILIGLAFPWFIQTAMVEPGSIAVINSRGMVYSVVLLFLTIIVTIGGIFLSHWQLTKRLGVVLLIVYCLFLIISILIEFNVLGYVNPPMCPD